MHLNEANNEILKERYRFTQEWQQIIHELRLIYYNYGILENSKLDR